MGRRKWKEFRRRWLVELIPPLAALLIRILSFTLRYRIHVSEEMRRIIASGDPVIFAFWHGRMLIMPPLYHKVCGTKRKDAWIMVSQHWDGELIARTVEPFRILSARGSSTRGGREALEELIEKAHAGHTIGITPDGPSGPRYCVQPGVVKIAQSTGVPIVPLTWAARPRWTASSWDQFQVPLPFARTSVVFDEPFWVPRDSGSAGLEPYRVLLEKRIRAVTDQMEAEVKEANAEGWLSFLRAWAKKTRSRLEKTLRMALQAFWAPSSPRGVVSRTLSILLAPLSVLYALVVQVRRSLYRKGILPKRRVDAPVISVGGVRVGGSGKTPFAQWMARKLSERGCRVVLLTRGYGRRKKPGTILLTRSVLDEWTPADCGDEPYLLAQGLPDVPVAVDGDRYRAAKLAEERFSPDLFIMDDGFQHLRLHRGFDIVLVPDEEALSTMACLPGGPLREPPSALKEADVLVRVCSDGWNEDDRCVSGEARWRALAGEIPVHRVRMVPGGLYRLEDGHQVDSQRLGGRRIAAFCGIARPNTFWRALDEMGLRLEARKNFPDHHPYSEQDHQELLGLLEVYESVVTTEKDAVKIRQYTWPEGKILFLRLDLALEDEPAFWARLAERFPRTKTDGMRGEKGV